MVTHTLTTLATVGLLTVVAVSAARRAGVHARTTTDSLTRTFDRLPFTGGAGQTAFGAGLPVVALLGVGALDAVGTGVVLQAITGLPLYAVILVLAVVLFVGPYKLAQRYDLGQAHSIGAGIVGTGFVFLLLIALQLLYEVA